MGAYLWEYLGAVDTFRLFGLMSATVAVAYGIAAAVIRARTRSDLQITKTEEQSDKH